MPNYDEQTVLQPILAIAMKIAPTGKEQQAFSNFYNAMKAEGESDREIALRLVGAIYDGMTYGNWPN